MSHEIDVQAQPRAWLMHSILQPHVSKYAEHLHRGRYAANTRRVYLCCVAHFAHWLTDERHTFDLVNEAGIARFISEHLPRCKCSYPVRRCDYEIRAAVAQLLEVLRAGGAISDELGVEDHIGRELVQFDAYMRDVGGLAANTRQQRQRVVGRFLAEQSGSGPIVATAITPKAVRRFVLGEKQGWSAGTVGVMGGAIGCYLRFAPCRAIMSADCWRPFHARLTGAWHPCLKFCPMPRSRNCSGRSINRSPRRDGHSR